MPTILQHCPRRARDRYSISKQPALAPRMPSTLCYLLRPPSALQAVFGHHNTHMPAQTETFKSVIQDRRSVGVQDQGMLKVEGQSHTCPSILISPTACFSSRYPGFGVQKKGGFAWASASASEMRASRDGLTHPINCGCSVEGRWSLEHPLSCIHFPLFRLLFGSSRDPT